MNTLPTPLQALGYFLQYLSVGVLVTSAYVAFLRARHQYRFMTKGVSRISPFDAGDFILGMVFWPVACWIPLVGWFYGLLMEGVESLGDWVARFYYTVEHGHPYCNKCHGKGWVARDYGSAMEIKRCVECGVYPTDYQARMARDREN